MPILKFSVDTTPVELRNLSLILNGMADQIETNINTGVSTTVDNSDMVSEPEFLGQFPFGNNGAPIDVFTNTPLLFEHINALPAETFEKYEGETIKPPVEKTAADAFGGDDEKTDDVNKPAEPATDVELDNDGIPWDVRIHGASKLKLKRGNTWKLKKGVDKDLVTTVIAELKALMSTSTTTVLDTVSNVTNIADAKPATPAGPAGPGPDSPASPAVEVKYVTDDGEWTREQLKGALFTDEQIDALPIAGQIVATGTTTLPELMQLITPALVANTITDEQVTAACVKHGIESIALIGARPDLIPLVKIELFG